MTYQSKKVLITGNTGFKGSWLASWLLTLGARVYGLSNGVPTIPSIFEKSNINKDVNFLKDDIRNFDSVKKAIHSIKPDFVFHLAAQPLVRKSYNDPLETLETNGLGTTNLLEALRTLDKPCIAIFITSDKVYDNVEWVWGYRETDALGGKDPYSASKAMAELAIKTYSQSYFSNPNHPVKVAVGRAGNVIGGGDWALDRIIPDAIRAWSENKTVELRNPNATRPWQHVLEPLSGYLWLGAKLKENPNLNGEAFNFGPKSEQNRTVLELIQELQKYWSGADYQVLASETTAKKEAGLLKLNCDKALHYLSWNPTLTFEETSRMTCDWYYQFYKGSLNIDALVTRDIEKYTFLAKERNSGWKF